MSADLQPDRSPSADGSEKKNHRRLTLYIIGAIVLAILVAIVFPRFAMMFDVGGQIFLRLLQMVVVPLVMASVMSGILGMGDIRKLGRPGGYAILYYLTTTVLAVTTGLIVVNIINPGEGIDPKIVEDARKEGAHEVDKAATAVGKRGQLVTWISGQVTSRERPGMSDAMEVPAEGDQFVLLTIVQEGAVETPASVQVQWSDDEETFQDLKQFTAGVAEGTFTEVIEIPKSARHVRLKYTSQTGRGFSTVTGRIAPGPPGIDDILRHLTLMLFTNNLLGSMVEINLLPLIVFSIVFAGMLTTMGERAKLIGNIVVAINDALMSFVMLLMRIAPIGIFCLVAARFGKAQADGKFLELLQTQAWYMLTVLSGLAIHAAVTLPLILWLITRRNPYRFVLQMSQAILTAFSTASSTATLPVTMECAEYNAGVSRRSVEFVLPLGATINMDGTALYEAAAAIFIAQAFGADLTMANQLTIAITATLAAIGAAGIPEAGLVTMLIVLNAVGLPLELVALIVPVDWLLDRFRTAVNAFGDSVGAAVVDPSFSD
jgi:Na+/H+-dicarboxylate symporter